MLSWPEVAPRHEGVVLREFESYDVDMVLDLASDPYVPLIGTLPAHADRDQAIAWIEQQRQRLTEAQASRSRSPISPPGGPSG